MTRTSHWRTIPGFVLVGKLGKTKGVDGALKLLPDSGRESDLLETKFLFLERDGIKVPYRVSEYQKSGDLLVSFTQLRSKDEAAEVVGCRVYVPSDEIGAPVEKPSDLAFHFLTGYTLHNGAAQVGIINEIREFPQQEMAVIIRDKAEVYVPLHPDLIESIDDVNMKIVMNLPEGLLSL